MAVLFHMPEILLIYIREASDGGFRLFERLAWGPAWEGVSKQFARRTRFVYEPHVLR